MNKPHFVFLTFEFPPAHGGGLSTYMKHACMALSEAGANVTVIVPDASVSGERKTATAYGATVVSFDPHKHSAFQSMGYWPALSYAISDQLLWVARTYGQPDLVETCDGFALGYFSMVRKFTLEAPFDKMHFVVTGHTPTSMIDTWEGHNPYKLPLYWTSVMEKWCFRAADQVDVPSRFLIQKLQADFDLDDLEMGCVPNPYRADKALTSSAASEAVVQNLPDREFACVISRVTKWKGIPKIIAAFAGLWEEGETIQLRVYGSDTHDINADKSMTEVLSTQYKKYIDDGQLVFAGLAAPAALADVRARSAFQVHPSENENFPYTVVEAMGDGNVVIGNRNGGQAELIQDGQSGFVFDLDDAGSFAKAYYRYRALDAEALRALRQAAQDRVSDYCSYESYAARKFETVEALKATAEKHDYPFVFGKQKTGLRTTDAPEKGRLTVVIPYYNMQEYIHETVESVMSSTIPVDMIIVNDGSTHPSTEDVLNTIQKSYPDIKIINKTNSGVAETRNLGVKAATTEFVSLLDADDLVTPEYYRRALEILNHYDNVGFVGCWSDDYNEEGTIRYWPTFAPEPPSQYLFNMVNAQSLVYRRSAYLAAGQNDPALQMYLDDWEGTIGLVDAGYRGVMIPHPLFRYRIRPDSIFRSGTWRWHKNFNYILEKHRAGVAEYGVEIAAFLNANGPNTLYHNPTYQSGLETGAGSSHAANIYDGNIMMKLVHKYYDWMRTPDAPFAFKVVKWTVFKPLIKIRKTLQRA